MKITVKTKYLVFPINTLGSHKKVRFTEAGREVYYLDMRLDKIAPNYYAYVDVARFMGRELTVESEPSMDVIATRTPWTFPIFTGSCCVRRCTLLRRTDG